MDISYDLHTKIPLKFRADGKFRILMVSDIHGGAGYAADKTIRALQALMDETKPDLVLFGGDTAGPGVIHIETAEQLREMLDGLSSPMENAGIPWAHVYGNHDDNFGLSNAEQQTVYEAYPHCVSKAGPADISGVGTTSCPCTARTGSGFCLTYSDWIRTAECGNLRRNSGFPPIRNSSSRRLSRRAGTTPFILTRLRGTGRPRVRWNSTAARRFPR